MSNSQLPSVTSNNGKTSASITHVTGGGNNNGGYINVGGQVSHDIGSNTQIYAQGNVGRSQSFNGGGGQNSYGGSIGIQKRF